MSLFSSNKHGCPIGYGKKSWTPSTGGEETMPRFLKLPIEIEAVQWLGSMEPVIELVGHDLPTYGEGKSGSLRIETKEGPMEVSMGDWIIKEPFPSEDRQFYPCKPDQFAKTYVPVVRPPDEDIPEDMEWDGDATMVMDNPETDYDTPVTTLGEILDGDVDEPVLSEDAPLMTSDELEAQAEAALDRPVGEVYTTPGTDTLIIGDSVISGKGQPGFSDEGYGLQCSDCEKVALLPWGDESRQTVKIDQFEGWEVPPVRCPDCAKKARV
jgi:hypothetical protein